MMRAGTLGYFAQLQGLGYVAALQSGANYHLEATHGIFGYEPNVDYLFGVPSQIRTGGIHLDIPILLVAEAHDGILQSRKNLLIQLGMTASSLEHETPEQMFNADPANPTQGISAVKALQLASQQGQRIYTITATNQATILPNIHHDSATMSEIQAALNLGQEVITQY